MKEKESDYINDFIENKKYLEFQTKMENTFKESDKLVFTRSFTKNLKDETENKDLFKFLYNKIGDLPVSFISWIIVNTDQDIYYYAKENKTNTSLSSACFRIADKSELLKSKKLIPLIYEESGNTYLDPKNMRIVFRDYYGNKWEKLKLNWEEFIEAFLEWRGLEYWQKQYYTSKISEGNMELVEESKNIKNELFR